jgi:hypothetical protein
VGPGPALKLLEDPDDERCSASCAKATGFEPRFLTSQILRVRCVPLIR